MAMLDKGLKQRMVGALVLVALAVIFLPMLLSREDEMRRVVVEAPAMPQAPATAEIVVEPAEVVEPEQLPQEPLPVEELEPQIVEVPEQPTPTPPAAQPLKPEPARTEQAAAPAQPQGRLDANNLPISWSVQLASLSSRSGAENLQKTLRSQGYNAYIRTFDGMNRVFVGPLIERAEAERLRDQLNRQHKLSGFVVRFQPEAG
ncbi:SPOR domain-containing protein [Pseudomonas guguanensis]|uniref:SPOR domain-containing protein n=1 Tax=Ectopseudomonas guguanensis TaxID=1198456 RepID=UPI00326751A0